MYVRTYADRFGVEPILAVLNEHGIGIAPSTYYAHQARGFGPSQRDLDDAYAANELHMLWKRNRRLYWRRKPWKTALRAGTSVGRDRVERLMRLAGISGIRRGKRLTVTIVSDPKAAKCPDHMNRRWSWPSRPSARAMGRRKPRTDPTGEACDAEKGLLVPVWSRVFNWGASRRLRGRCKREVPKPSAAVANDLRR